MKEISIRRRQRERLGSRIKGGGGSAEKERMISRRKQKRRT